MSRGQGRLPPPPRPPRPNRMPYTIVYHGFEHCVRETLALLLGVFTGTPGTHSISRHQATEGLTYSHMNFFEYLVHF